MIGKTGTDGEGNRTRVGTVARARALIANKPIMEFQMPCAYCGNPVSTFWRRRRDGRVAGLVSHSECFEKEVALAAELMDGFEKLRADFRANRLTNEQANARLAELKQLNARASFPAIPAHMFSSIDEVMRVAAEAQLYAQAQAQKDRDARRRYRLKRRQQKTPSPEGEG